MATERTKITIQAFNDFMAQDAHADKRYELINGEIIEMSPVSFPHGKIVLRIGGAILVHAQKHQLGEVVTEVGTYRADDEQNVFAPDVAFYRVERFPQPAPEGFVPQMPDWAVEVVSPSDLNNKGKRIDAKISAYRAARVPLLWYVYPKRQTVEVYRPEQAMRIFTSGDILEATPVMPGFTLAVDALFA